MNKKVLMAIGATALLSISLQAKTPDVLGYEKILNDTLSKQSVDANKNNPNLNLPNFNNTASPGIAPSVQAFEFNVVGVIDINGKKIAWFLTKEGKLLKVKKGLFVGGKEVIDVSDYGVTLKDGNDKLFMPVLHTKIEESSIAFSSNNSSKEAKK